MADAAFSDLNLILKHTEFYSVDAFYYQQHNLIVIKVTAFLIIPV